MQATAYKLQPGDAAPVFQPLPATDGRTYSLDSFRDKKALVIFWHCNHCPYANAFEDRLNQVAKDYTPKGAGFLAINSNDVHDYAEDSFPKMKERAKAKGYVFPYAFDESQDVARAYGAVCTPHVLVFDEKRRLAYQGRPDGFKDDPAKGNAQELRDALDDLLAPRKVRTPTTLAFGCGIKWSKTHFAAAKK